MEGSAYAPSGSEYSAAAVPDMVKQFVVYFYRHIRCGVILAAKFRALQATPCFPGNQKGSLALDTILQLNGLTKRV